MKKIELNTMNFEELEIFQKKVVEDLIKSWEKIECLKESDWETYKEKVRLEWELKKEIAKEKIIKKTYDVIEAEIIIRLLADQ